MTYRAFKMSTKQLPVYWALLFCSMHCFSETVAPLQIIPEHAAITTYEGPRTCIQCHEDAALDMYSTVHYQWTGMTPYATNIPGQAGKADLGFNTYCGTVVTSRRIACWACHVGNGKTPTGELDMEQVNNIDCLMCHSQMYQRKAVAPYPQADINLDRYVDLGDLTLFSQEWLSMGCTPMTGCHYTDFFSDGQIDLMDFRQFAMEWLTCTDPGGTCNFQWTETLTYVDYLGVSHSWTLPVEDENGDFQFGPDEAAMAIDIVQAAQMAHLPTRETCLRCHAYAAGTDCGKRGDLGTASVSPPVDVDVHMSQQGQNFSCQRCHISVEHKILGRGLDIRPSERMEKMTCLSGGCHSIAPHSNTRLDTHTSRVACQTCHIPQFAKLNSTEIERDWTNPNWAQGLFGGQGGFKPEEIRDMFMIPTYRWYDGTSRVYALGQVAALNGNGQYEFGVPNGDVASPDAKIHPMKEHLSNSARHDETGVIIPHSTSEFFFTGDFNRAVQKGMELTGMTGSWTMVPIHTFQTINHGVEPTYNALECGQCHDVYSGGPVRIDLQSLGYGLKGSVSFVCTQCHGPEENKPFDTIHNKHVSDKKFDCSWCHTFSRPERNLTLP
jgi:hypothetical protein